MSSPYVGISDFIPQIQPFHPDLNFYSNVLSTKQAQYDSGYQKMSGLYSSILNSPMLRDGNINRRDEFLKAIDQDVKKVAGLDLSKQENVELASKIFEPFYNDKNIIHDIAFTKKYQGELGKAENFRNCVDPDKCGGSYWDKGVQAMQYQAEEYKKATSEEALNYESPKFKPFVNVTQKAIKAAKDAGFNVELDSVSKGYIVTDKNGTLLLGNGKDDPGVLPQFLYGMFGQDQAIQDVFKTQAYVQRKDFAKANAGMYGSEDAAESFYLNDIIRKSVPHLEKSANASRSQLDYLDAQKKILQDQMTAQGVNIANSKEETALELIDALYEKNQAATAYHEGVLNEIKTAPNLNDLKALRNRADGIVANSYFQHTLDSAAYDYAMGTAKRELKADPYALERFRTSQNIYEHAANLSTDDKYWEKHNATTFEQQVFLKGLGKGIGAPKLTVQQENILKTKGYTPHEIAMITPQDKNALINAGIITPEGKDVNIQGGAGGEKVTSNYADNVNYFSNQSKKNFTEAKGNVHQLLTNLVNQYDIAANGPDKSSALLIKKSLDNILAQTPLRNADGLLSDRRSMASNLQKIDDVSAAKAQAVTEKEVKNVVNGGWVKFMDKNLLNNMSTSNLTQDAVEGLGKTFSNNFVTAVKDKIQHLPGTSNELDHTKTATLYKSLINTKVGLMATQDQAERNFIRDASKYFPEKRELPHSKEATEYIVTTSAEQASKYFKEKYAQVRNEVENAVPGVKDYYKTVEGGAAAPMFGKEYSVKATDEGGANVFSTNLATAIKQNPADFKILSGEPSLATAFFNYYDQAVQNKDKKFGFDLITTVHDKEKKGGDIIEPSTVYKINLNPDVAHEIYKKNYDPTQDYSFTVSVPSEKDPNQFSERVALNPIDSYMKMAGANLTVDHADGKYILTNDGKNVTAYPVFSALAADFDNKGNPTNVRYENVTGTSDVIPKNINVSEAISQGKDFLALMQQKNQNLIQSIKKGK